MIVRDFIEHMETIAPPEAAESWDNVGLHVGSIHWPARRVMLTIDLTDDILEEAISQKAQLIVAYHPLVFEPLKSLTDRTMKERIALRAAGEKIAIYCPHTALDAARGGVNDWLAAGCGAGDVRALDCARSLPESEQCKIITFCPADAADQLRNALAAVGAGRIGDYEQCSFETLGMGTFLGGADTKPLIGRAGRLERTEELKLEMVCPESALGLAVLTLRRFHPYEEPPIEVHKLELRPDREIGSGRRVILDQRVSLKELVERIKKQLGVRQVQVAAARRSARTIQRIGLCAGAGQSFLDTAIAQRCQVFLTGEMGHHHILDAQARGCSVILAGHTNTERGYLKVLKRTLQGLAPGATITVSRRDAHPLKVM